MTIHSLVPLRFCNEKKITFGIFTGFGHLQTSETSGRNMARRVRQPASTPSKNWMGKWRFYYDFKKKTEIFADTSAFNARWKGKNTKTNKIIIVKNRKLATQNFLFNMHINFPFDDIKRLFLLWKICLNIILWNIGIICFIIELHQFTSGTFIHTM